VGRADGKSVRRPHDRGAQPGLERGCKDGVPGEEGGAKQGTGQTATGSYGRVTGVAFGPPRSGFVLLQRKSTVKKAQPTRSQATGLCARGFPVRFTQPHRDANRTPARSNVSITVINVS
jgi:hypothetical protein